MELVPNGEATGRLPQEGEEALRSLVHLSPDGIVIIDATGNVIEWNEGEERITGIPRSEAMGRPLWELQHRLAPDERRTPAFLAEAREKIVRGLGEGLGMRRVLEEEIQRPDGSRRTVQSVLVAMRGRQGIIAGGMSRDVTERRRAEEALRAENLQLAEGERRRDELLAVLAHELRDPLAAISCAIRILHDSGTEAPAGQKACEAAGRQVAHATRLVDDLLEAARVSRRKVVLRRERVELSAVVASAVEASLPALQSSGQTLSVSLPPKPLVLQGDRARLTQVLSNLLGNARKFTPPAGEIRLSAREEAGHVLLTVADTGRGIEASLLPRVFEPFVQGDRSQDGAPHGLGVGLAIVRELVEMHGGRVSARSAWPGQGSEFLVWLPLTEDSRGPGQAHPQTPGGAPVV